MPRRTTCASIFAALALCALGAIGCAAETNEPELEVFYDHDAGKCYTKDEDGTLREVPCGEEEHPRYETLDGQQGGCATPADCTQF